MADYRFSYWERSTVLSRPDVLIVGAGLTGLQTALAIKQSRPDWSITVLERGPFSRGASTRNAGFACFGSPTELLEDLEGGDATEVWDTVERRYAGIRRLAEEHGPFVDYHNDGGYEVFRDLDIYREVVERLPDLNQELRRITGWDSVWHSRESLPGLRPEVPVLANGLEGQLHPGKLVGRLEQKCHEKGIRLLFGCPVTGVDVDRGQVWLAGVNRESLVAERLILTTNAFTSELWPAAEIQPARNQVFLTSPVPQLTLRGCFHYDRGYVYFRNVGPDRLLIGGGRQLVGPEENTTTFGPNDELEGLLGEELHRYVDLPRYAYSFEQSWSGIIAQGGDKSPILRRAGKRTLVAARLAGMGVALSAQLAREAAEMTVETSPQ